MLISSSAYRPVVRTQIFRDRLFIDVLAGHDREILTTLQLSAEEAHDLLSALQTGLKVMERESEQETSHESDVPW